MYYNIINEITAGLLSGSNIALKTIWEALGSSGQMFVLGIVAAFALLGVIFVGINVYRRLYPDAYSDAYSPQSDNSADDLADSHTAEVDENEIVAVIAAAIACAESEHPGVKFKVVSFKRN